MTNVFAGVLRNRRAPVATPKSEGARACRLGADLAYGLECA